MSTTFVRHDFKYVKTIFERGTVTVETYTVWYVYCIKCELNYEVDQASKPCDSQLFNYSNSGDNI